MSHGDLSERIPVTSKNEIGLFSESFNSMTEQLENFIKNLDRQVKVRTQEVEDKNIKLNESLHRVKSMQEQLVVQEKLASLGQLTAGIAHEIKNPLNFINNFAQLSEKQISKLRDLIVPVSKQLNESENASLTKVMLTIESNMQKIHQYGERADSIIRNMLDHSRSGTSRNFQLTNINALLEENFKLVYHAQRAVDNNFNIEMQMKFDDGLGDVEILPQEIGRVSLNILNNAFYAIGEKKKILGESYLPVVAIQTKLEKNEMFSITFYDNGIGMPEEVLEKLYTPFYTTKPPGQGTGLGLSLSREIIVGAHQGEIHVDSKSGEFTSFTLILPRKHSQMES